MTTVSGRALGSLVGGNLIGLLGIRITFRVAACIAAFTCICYFIANHCFFYKVQRERREKAKEKLNEELQTGHNTDDNEKVQGIIVKSEDGGNEAAVNEPTDTSYANDAEIIYENRTNMGRNTTTDSTSDTENAASKEYVNPAFGKEN